MEWFLKYREDLKPAITYCEPCSHFCHRMLAAPTHDRLVRTLRYMLDENEFLSPYGLRSVSSIAKSITCSSRGTRNIVLIMCGREYELSVRRKFQLARPDLVSHQ
jgi:hypothetical protein